jgi:hypothetical protein
LPDRLKASRRARLAGRDPAALKDSVRAASETVVTLALGSGTAADATGAATTGLAATDRLPAVVLPTPALPCKAIAWRRLRASTRPDRVALAVLSAAFVITYLDQLGLVEHAAVAGRAPNRQLAGWYSFRNGPIARRHAADQRYTTKAIP